MGFYDRLIEAARPKPVYGPHEYGGFHYVMEQAREGVTVAGVLESVRDGVVKVRQMRRDVATWVAAGGIRRLMPVNFERQEPPKPDYREYFQDPRFSALYQQKYSELLDAWRAGSEFTPASPQMQALNADEAYLESMAYFEGRIAEVEGRMPAAIRVGKQTEVDHLNHAAAHLRATQDLARSRARAAHGIYDHGTRGQMALDYALANYELPLDEAIAPSEAAQLA